MEDTQKAVGEPNESKNSIELLHVTKPVEDLSINSPNKKTEPESCARPAPETKLPAANEQPTKIETVFQPSNMDAEKTSSIMGTAISGDIQKEGLKLTEQVAAKHEEEISSNNIYSVTGSPSGRISRRDVGSKVFPVGCMGCKDAVENKTSDSKVSLTAEDDGLKRRPSSALPSLRNPVTGTGLQNPDVRRASSKKKDGNPLLGTGYDEQITTQSKSRIPPGGFSQGLW